MTTHVVSLVPGLWFCAAAPMHISTENNIYNKWMISDVLHRDFDNFKRFDAFFTRKNQLLTSWTKIKFREVVKKTMIHYIFTTIPLNHRPWCIVPTTGVTAGDDKCCTGWNYCPLLQSTDTNFVIDLTGTSYTCLLNVC